jgi:hypothetical protein
LISPPHASSGLAFDDARPGTGEASNFLLRPDSDSGYDHVDRAVTVVEQAIETSTVFDTHGFTGPGGDMNFLLGVASTAIWFGGLVVWTVRGPGHGGEELSIAAARPQRSRQCPFEGA